MSIFVQCSRVIPLFLFWVFILKVTALPDTDFKTNLGIRVNALTEIEQTDEGADAKYLVYTGVVEYEENTATLLKDVDLISLSYQAYLGMVSAHALLAADCGGKFPEMPPTMTAISIGKRVYFGSALREQKDGGLFHILMKDSLMTAELNACAGTKRHSTGSCGELIATAMYVQENGHLPRAVTRDPKGRPIAGINARVTTWGGYEKWSREMGGYNIPACNPAWPNQYGCRGFMERQGIRVVTNDEYRSGKRKEGEEDPPVPPVVEKAPKETFEGGFTIKKLVGWEFLDDDDMDFEAR
ncbi:MAG: hypothetical protein M1833_001408 [Piccolia ochrophora]|nr:MAG: hypothetical protein M1833_001408 [Piccolia ochrophora]